MKLDIALGIPSAKDENRSKQNTPNTWKYAKILKNKQLTLG